jgi:uncharacterized protein YrzB (UPF0473 family)
MTGFEAFEEDAAISMFDEDGNEAGYHILASKKRDGSLYMLAEADDIDGFESEVLIFKCVAEAKDDDMVFELVDESHESFDLAFALFKDDLDTMGIEY